DLLARYVEPAVAWASLLEQGTGNWEHANGLASTRGLLRQAWKQLLQNGPHDSVTGCSVDAVNEDIAARFNHVEQIGEALLFESQRQIARVAAPEGQSAVVVFNPEHGPRTDFCTVRLPVQPGKWPAKVVAEDGTEAPLQVIERGGYSPVDPRERVTFGFVASEVPGFGYRAMQLEYGEGQEELGTGNKEQGIETEFFRVSADSTDGTLTLEDKRTGRRLTGLNRFVDGGERGDEYTYDQPELDEFVDRPSGPVDVRVTEAGPARWTLEVRMTYALPASLTDDRKGRSAERADCEIVTRASLYPGVARVDIETEVENRAKDHRLRVHFPTGVVADRSYAEQHFGVVERPIGLPEYDGTWLETPVAFYPQKSFVDISDGTHGVMLANRGLPEYEAILEPDGTVTIALTLLRCVEWLSRQDLATRHGHAGPGMHTPGAQMIGRWKFQYSLIPHAGGWENAYAEAHRFVRPMRAVRVSRGNGGLPAAGSLIEIQPPEVILSALKLAEDDGSVIARVYNIGESTVCARVTLYPPSGLSARAAFVDMNEENREPLSLDADDGVDVWLDPNEIKTLEFGIRNIISRSITSFAIPAVAVSGPEGEAGVGVPARPPRPTGGQEAEVDV
ncbi:MAG TPA: glycoside hydrolase family 38 C-terminal domain-containing protein, partial [Dehalococcoidia bacterium]|nr:glycoside hydrolase family 38 C-terminal domain-containing protein [Dehalococcoidia bacterium]